MATQPHHDAPARNQNPSTAGDKPDQAADKISKTFRDKGGHDALALMQKEYQDHAKGDPSHFKQWSSALNEKLQKNGVLPELSYEYGAENFDGLKDGNGSMYASSIKDKGMDRSDRRLSDGSQLRGSDLGDEQFKNTMMHTLADKIRNGGSGVPYHWGKMGFGENYTNKSDLEGHVKGFQDKLKGDKTSAEAAAAEAKALAPLAKTVEGGKTLQDFIASKYGNKDGQITKDSLQKYLDDVSDPQKAKDMQKAYPKAFSDQNQKFVKSMVDNWDSAKSDSDPAKAQQNKTMHDAIEHAQGTKLFSDERDSFNVPSNAIGAPDKPQGEHEVVGKGGSAWPIAKKWGVSEQELIQYNEEKQHLWSERFGNKSEAFMKKSFVLDGWTLYQPPKEWIDKHRASQ